jgi:hypothetical protein
MYETVVAPAIRRPLLLLVVTNTSNGVNGTIRQVPTKVVLVDIIAKAMKVTALKASSRPG